MRFRDVEIKKLSETMWEIPREEGMRVPGLIFASEAMMGDIVRDESVRQVMNVAYLPGILKHSIGMPDIHWGYGFPIGGVAAMDAEEGVVSPGGVGYDINCGVRLLRSDLTVDALRPKLRELLATLHREVPSGVGSTGFVRLSAEDEEKVLVEGSRWAASRGYASAEDIACTESGGKLPGADPDAVSAVAKKRGRNQLGTLGSGNHFLEIDEVAEVFDEEAARAFGLFPGQAAVVIHSGSRGLGYQVCDDYLVTMADYMRRNAIDLPDRQLASMGSPTGSCLRTRPGSASCGFWGWDRGTWECDWYTTAGITTPSSRCTRSTERNERSSSTGRAQPAASPRGTRRFRKRTGTSDNRSSSRGIWGLHRSSWPDPRRRCAYRSARPATARAAE
jgi:hypothetical protein